MLLYTYETVTKSASPGTKASFRLSVVLNLDPWQLHSTGTAPGFAGKRRETNWSSSRQDMPSSTRRLKELLSSPTTWSFSGAMGRDLTQRRAATSSVPKTVASWHVCSVRVAHKGCRGAVTDTAVVSLKSAFNLRRYLQVVHNPTNLSAIPKFHDLPPTYQESPTIPSRTNRLRCIPRPKGLRHRAWSLQWVCSLAPSWQLAGTAPGQGAEWNGRLNSWTLSLMYA